MVLSHDHGSLHTASTGELTIKRDLSTVFLRQQFLVYKPKHMPPHRGSPSFWNPHLTLLGWMVDGTVTQRRQRREVEEAFSHEPGSSALASNRLSHVYKENLPKLPYPSNHDIKQEVVISELAAFNCNQASKNSGQTNKNLQFSQPITRKLT